METTDKRILDKVIHCIEKFNTQQIENACKIHPLDEEILDGLRFISGKLNSDDEFEIFKYREKVEELWENLINKSIISLRYYDVREPFSKNKEKCPHAYGVEQLNEYFKNYSDFESVLYGGAKFYRDHVIHVFRVWLLGIQLLLQKEYIELIKICPDVTVNQHEKISIWTLIALTHDLGYPLEKALQIIDRTKNMMKSFVVNPTVSMDLSFSGVQNSMNDFVLRLISSKMKRINEEDQPSMIADGEVRNDRYVARLQPKYYFKLQKSLEHNKHGILSSLIIYNTSLNL